METSDQNLSFDSVVNSQPELKFIDYQCVSLMYPVSLYNSENEYDTADPLNLFRTPTNKTVLISEIPNVMIDYENIIITPGEGKTPQSLINDELAFPKLFPSGKFGSKVERDIKLSASKYFNQRLYTQNLSSCASSIFFCT